MSTKQFEWEYKGKQLSAMAPDGPWKMAYNEGYSPVEMLVLSVAGCGGYVYTSILENSKIPFKLKKTIVQYTRDEAKKTQPLKSVTIHFEMEIPVEFQERALRCLSLISANCPVMQSLDSTIEVIETVAFV